MSIPIRRRGSGSRRIARKREVKRTAGRDGSGGQPSDAIEDSSALFASERSREAALVQSVMPDRLCELDGGNTGAVRLGSSATASVGDAAYQRVGMVHRTLASGTDIVARA